MNEYVKRLIKQRMTRVASDAEVEQRVIDNLELQLVEARSRRADLVAEHESLFAELAAGKPTEVTA